jgi:hypothetical protein
MESECAIPDCPIRNDPDNQVGELWGASISFAAPSAISQEDRISRFSQWERLGLDRLKRNLETNPFCLVGSQDVQDLAREWVRGKQTPETQDSPPTPKAGEVLILKPMLWGVGIDLKEGWRRLGRWLRGGNQ